MRFYFCTTSDRFGDSMILSPRVPKSLETGREDDKTNRICVSPSILGALSSIGQNIGYESEVNVYCCDISDGSSIRQPTFKEVADVEYTGEFWILKDTEFKLLKKIVINHESNFYIEESRIFNFEFALKCCF